MGEKMELRFIMEHAEATVTAARKMKNLGSRERCAALLEELGGWLMDRFKEGVLEPPNIDIKPAEPG